MTMAVSDTPQEDAAAGGSKHRAEKGAVARGAAAEGEGQSPYKDNTGGQGHSNSPKHSSRPDASTAATTTASTSHSMVRAPRNTTPTPEEAAKMLTARISHCRNVGQLLAVVLGQATGVGSAPVEGGARSSSSSPTGAPSLPPSSQPPFSDIHLSAIMVRCMQLIVADQPQQHDADPAHTPGSVQHTATVQQLMADVVASAAGGQATLRAIRPASAATMLWAAARARAPLGPRHVAGLLDRVLSAPRLLAQPQQQRQRPQQPQQPGQRAMSGRAALKSDPQALDPTDLSNAVWAVARLNPPVLRAALPPAARLLVVALPRMSGAQVAGGLSGLAFIVAAVVT